MYVNPITISTILESGSSFEYMGETVVIIPAVVKKALTNERELKIKIKKEVICK